LSRILPGTLKCVVVSGDARPVVEALRGRIGRDDVRQMGESVLVHTALEPSELRDHLAAAAGSRCSVLVVEFEKWSGHGDAVDRAWLLARGH
jgi:hypothetical protein